MSSRPIVALVVGALLALAACGPGGGASPSAIAAGPPEASHASASPGAPSVSASSAPSASASASVAACRETGDPGSVEVSIADFEFKPPSIAAMVGDVVAFSNTGFEPHNATVGFGCGTRTLQTGESDGLVFTVPGSYAFGCTVHPWMTGKFTIAR